MSAIPEFVRLSGDEDGDVTALCYHASHDDGAAYNLPIAFYGWSDCQYEVPAFKADDLAGFVTAIAGHAETHAPSTPPGGSA